LKTLPQGSTSQHKAISIERTSPLINLKDSKERKKHHKGAEQTIYKREKYKIKGMFGNIYCIYIKNQEII